MNYVQHHIKQTTDDNPSFPIEINIMLGNIGMCYTEKSSHQIKREFFNWRSLPPCVNHIMLDLYYFRPSSHIKWSSIYEVFAILSRLFTDFILTTTHIQHIFYIRFSFVIFVLIYQWRHWTMAYRTVSCLSS